MRRIADRAVRPAARLLHVTFGLSPSQVSWFAFAVSAGAAASIALGRIEAGLALMLAGQVLDGLDGAMARTFGLQSPQGHRLDTLLDRASETVIFLAFAAAGRVSLELALLAVAAVLLLTTVCDRSGLDPGAKRVVLYLGLWVPYPVLFEVIFGVNLAAYVIGLLVIDCQFQRAMDALGGDLDTVASRAVALEDALESDGHATKRPPSRSSAAVSA
ncbi:MAG TPA: CDP-alcohol phosphatidyltransferase family protein [Gemmatimonadales bacterium]|nr:CDP-alcohol phosphatidyltransferase family protein [Gemmatimonadales bacterium]